MNAKHFRCPGMIKKLSDCNCKIADNSNLKNKIIFFTLLHYLSELKGSLVQRLVSQLGYSFSPCFQRTPSSGQQYSILRKVRPAKVAAPRAVRTQL